MGTQASISLAELGYVFEQVVEVMVSMGKVVLVLREEGQAMILVEQGIVTVEVEEGEEPVQELQEEILRQVMVMKQLQSAYMHL